MKIFELICLIDIILLILGYFIGYWAVKKESDDIFQGEISIEIKKSEKLTKEWDEYHPILRFFQCFYYEIKRKFDIPGDTCREIKWFIQRGRRGYSDRDIWGFDFYLSEIICGGINELKNQVHGVPGEIAEKFKDKNDSDSIDIAMIEWKRILGEISWTFETSIKIQENDLIPVFDERKRKQADKFVKSLNMPQKEEDKLFKDLPDVHYNIMSKEDTKRYKNGWKFFKQYYYGLWD